MPDPKDTTMDMLENDSKYNRVMLDDINKGYYQSILKYTTSTDRGNYVFMMPLLYAVKERSNTYKVFEYLSESLQNDTYLGSKIIVDEPELIENTPLANNKDFILNNIGVNPKIIEYASYNLKSDPEFLHEAYERYNTPTYLAELAHTSGVPMPLILHPELANDMAYMSGLIALDVTALAYLGSELKDNYDYLYQESNKNDKVIDYVALNGDAFGLNGIKGVRQSSREYSEEKGTGILEELAKIGEDPRYAKVLTKVKENPKVPQDMRYISAMLAQSKNIDSNIVIKIVDYAILSMNRIQKELDSNGNEKLDQNLMMGLVEPKILHKLIDNIRDKSLDLSPLLKKLEEYEKWYLNYKEKYIENRRRNFQKQQESADKERADDQYIEKTAPTKDDSIRDNIGDDKNKSKDDKEPEKNGEEQTQTVFSMPGTGEKEQDIEPKLQESNEIIQNIAKETIASVLPGVGEGREDSKIIQAGDFDDGSRDDL